MAERNSRNNRPWAPPAPHHSRPWADWVHHTFDHHHDMIRDLHEEVTEQGQELERRRILIEARQNSLWSKLLASAGPQLGKIVFGLLCLLITYLLTGQPPDPAAVKAVLKGP